MHNIDDGKKKRKRIGTVCPFNMNDCASLFNFFFKHLVALDEIGQ